MAKFNPNEPRDRKGQWTHGNGPAKNMFQPFDESLHTGFRAFRKYEKRAAQIAKLPGGAKPPRTKAQALAHSQKRDAWYKSQGVDVSKPAGYWTPEQRAAKKKKK